MSIKINATNFTAGSDIPFQEMTTLTREQLKAYAEASGDPNPIHLEDEAAQKAGLPGVIAHGMLSAGFLGERALQLLQAYADLRKIPADRLQIQNFRVRFKGMTFPGDTVSVGGRVRSVSEDGLVLELAARNQKQEITTTAVVQIVSDTFW
jgi:acyl dehydratase